MNIHLRAAMLVGVGQFVDRWDAADAIGRPISILQEDGKKFIESVSALARNA